MKLKLATLLALSISTWSLAAPTGEISFTQPVEPDPTNYQSYTYNHAGDTETHTYVPFSVTVDYGTGAAASLVGKDFIAFCVNPVFTTPGDGTLFDYATDGSVLSYDLDGAGPGPDYWGINNELKFNALKDVFATYANQIVNSDLSSLDSANLITAIGFVVSEIVMDYNGSIASLNLNAGNSLVTNGDLSPISGSILTYYNNVVAAVGTGVGSNFELHAAGTSSNLSQDMVFFAVPEPSGAILFMTACLGFMLRRRRLS